MHAFLRGCLDNMEQQHVRHKSNINELYSLNIPMKKFVLETHLNSFQENMYSPIQFFKWDIKTNVRKFLGIINYYFVIISE